ncbi:hypothetical protein A4H97_05670 [Niastella yeongjuensis]|uniref:DUF1640 domain-containing protein n=1 Tax=Niastella yeongjuensis TaxID=354355 RepID=A0A1V9EMB1_9BACT|nr:hypothetical protein [Niastella yeongjuensis]OQP47005.1 hypothetical protein A4H97_05670 [Niastella yeongjuensis]SEN65121.1 hypothetical protein SAMN05660816_01159 [Niastella yeongjuensis]
MPTITITKLYDLVSVKLGKETAENLTTFIEEKIKGEVDTKTSILATKEDLARERADIIKDAANNRAETIKWMFLFWIGQMAAMFGLLMLFLKK